MNKTANELFYDMQVRHLVYLQLYSSHVSSRINTVLNNSEKALEEKLLAKLPKLGKLSTQREWDELNNLLQQIKQLRSDAWNKDDFFEKELQTLAVSEVTQFTKMAETAIPVVIATNAPDMVMIKNIARSRPFQGKLLRDWAKKLQSDDLSRIQSAIQVGMTIGETTPQIVKRVIGTAEVNGVDAVTQLTRDQVSALVRTSISHVTNNAREEFLNANAELFPEDIFVSVLDGRTTLTCAQLDGQVFPRGKGPKPPLHFSCRSLRVAKIGDKLLGDRPAKPVTEKMLVRQYAKENNLGSIAKRDDLPYGTKTNYDKWARGRVRELVGPIPSSTVYKDWIGKQSKEFQVEALGKTKAQLFRDGGLSLDKFVDKQYQPITLKQLAKLEADAFRRAGLDPNKF